MFSCNTISVPKSQETPPVTGLMSLTRYKIDFNHPLGSGKYGTIYEIVPRPENEKGYASKWFPCLYDYLFRLPKDSDRTERNLCVKLYNSSFYIFLKSRSYAASKKSISEPEAELKANKILCKHHFNKMSIFASDNMYVQFKSLVRGNTLAYYI